MDNDTLTQMERDVLTLLIDHTYVEVSQMLNVSRGMIWRIAQSHGARKHEERIRMRQADRAIALDPDLLNRTVKADVLEYLHDVPDNALSLWCTSPPFNIGKVYDGLNLDRRPTLHYVGWMMQIISEMARTLKENGVICLQLGNTFLDDGSKRPLDVIFDEHLRAAGLTFQSRVILPKAHGLIPRRRLCERYETMLIFCKGSEPTFNVNAVRVPQLNPGKKAFKGARKGEPSGHPLGKALSDVWTIPQIKANNPERTGHPAQFCEDLAWRAAMLYTNPGDLIGDPFSGSGTVQVAAKRTGRAFTGADLCFESLREQRVAKAEPDRVCPLRGVTAESAAVWEAFARRRDVPAPPTTPRLEHQRLLELFAANDEPEGALAS